MATTLPPSFPPSFDGAESVVALNVPIEAALRALAFAAVVLRFIARRAGRLHCGWDDWLILILALAFIPGTVWKMYMYSIGLGRHIGWVLENESPGTLDIYGKLAYVDVLHYAPAVLLIKLSILLFYVRIFRICRPFVWFCYGQMVLVGLWCVISESFWIFRCTPTWMAWMIVPADGACRSIPTVFFPTTLASVITDYMILLTPVYMVWSLHLSKQKKLLITVVLMIGASECIFSTVRLVKTSQLFFHDVTWDRASMSLWCSAECDLGIVCACIPTFGTLLPHSWRDKTAGSSAADTATKTSRFSYSPSPAMAMKFPTADAASTASDSPPASPWIYGENRGDYLPALGIVRTTEFFIDRSSVSFSV